MGRRVSERRVGRKLETQKGEAGRTVYISAWSWMYMAVGRSSGLQPMFFEPVGSEERAQGKSGRAEGKGERDQILTVDA